MTAKSRLNRLETRSGSGSNVRLIYETGDDGDQSLKALYVGGRNRLDRRAEDSEAFFLATAALRHPNAGIEKVLSNSRLKEVIEEVGKMKERLLAGKTVSI